MCSPARFFCQRVESLAECLPITSLGLCTDNDTIRVATGLRLGAPSCRPHSYHHCGDEVDSLATQGLSCRWSERRLHQHAAVNDITHRALVAAKVPSRLEPVGLYRMDGKSPGSMESCWCGTRPDPTLLPYPIHQVPPGRQEL